MSENTKLNPQPKVSPETTVTEPEVNVPAATDTAPADETTIGTGTSMALGCIAGTILLIIIGLLFLFISTLV